jgi:hypothetical protein
MATGYSRTPWLLKGALVALSEPFLGPVPNVIVFQYNPESLTRNLNPWTVPEEPGKEATEKEKEKYKNALTEPFDPEESFNLVLELDATDALEQPETHPVAFVSGVADRLAAMEMLMYPPGDSLLGSLLGGLGGLVGSLGGALDVLPRTHVPVVLLIWGPGRIVPVRLTSYSVEEQAFSPLLYPIRAKVTVGLRVVPPEALGVADPDDPNKRKYTTTEKLAVWAYKFTRGQKEVLARASLANTIESIIGMLPL